MFSVAGAKNSRRSEICGKRRVLCCQKTWAGISSGIAASIAACPSATMSAAMLAAEPGGAGLLGCWIQIAGSDVGEYLWVQWWTSDFVLDNCCIKWTMFRNF